jgi:hypothetical protein
MNYFYDGYQVVESPYLRQKGLDIKSRLPKKRRTAKRIQIVPVRVVEAEIILSNSKIMMHPVTARTLRSQAGKRNSV